MSREAAKSGVGGRSAPWDGRTSGCRPSAGRAGLHPIPHQDRVDYSPSRSPPSPDVGSYPQLPRSGGSGVLSTVGPAPRRPTPTVGSGFRGPQACAAWSTLLERKSTGLYTKVNVD